MDNIIKTYSELEKLKEKMEIEIQEMKEEYKINKTISSSWITKDLLNIVLDKINKLIKQKENKKINSLEKTLNTNIKNLNNQQEKYENEIEDILAVLTSSIKKNKRVIKVSLTSIKGKKDIYIAYLSSDIQYEITEESDIELAKRYLEIQKLFKSTKKDILELKENFEKEIKKIGKEYIKNDFEIELSALSNLSKEYFEKLEELNKKSFINFYGNENDFNEYKKILINIEERYKELKEREKHNWEIN